MKRQYLKIDPPLPCAAIEGSGVCGQPASVARAVSADSLPGWQQLGLTAGEWVLLPLCRACIQRTAQIYDVGSGPRKEI